MASRPHSSSPAIPRPPRDLALACAAGLGLGALTAVIVYATYVRTGDPTWAGFGTIPISALIVGALYVVLARRRQPRASEWVVLGYTAAIILSTVLLTLHAALHALAEELGRPVW